MKLKTITLAAVSGLLPVIALSACTSGGGNGGGNGNSILNQQQAADAKQYAFVQPLPYFPFSRIRQNVIEAEAIDALGINSTTFFFINGIDHPVFQCASVGVPVPATDQLSNPSVAQWNSGGSSNGYAIAGVPVGQMEPDGVFAGDTTGTNTLCLDGKGAEFLGYNEAYDVSFTAVAHWDPNALGPGKGQIIVTGNPVIPVCKIKVLNAAKHKAEEICTDPSGKAKPPVHVTLPAATPAASK